ncbi:hypothetical protein [Paenibacillus sp. J2TS4]|uniref:hypothetical protein n=1 Tax=Paenibacillus sp. J2TS4 TaxID=2807194 RepID=UPI001B13F15C|nr:hypothetical protein [Paenibacillus sp. J2TS4]GIP36063.1 hypothetical protein J2TS4_52730 [Paenibacillus sp. J2TS4]
MRTAKGKEMKKIVLGSVAAIAVTAMVFGGISQTVKAAEFGKTQAIPTNYNIPYAESVNNNVPDDYVKKDYTVKFVGQDQPTVNDMKMEEAAELASQNLWRIFQADLSGQTLEMTYNPISTIQLRPIWEVNVSISDTLSYTFALDAVTGENHSIAKWAYHKADIPEGMDINLLKNNQEYQDLAKAAAEKYQLVSGKVTSVEYRSQGYQTTNDGTAKNADITFQVKSDKGEVARLTFSRYDKDLLTIEYSSWIEETERLEKRIEQELKEKTEEFIITDELMKKIEENGSPMLLEIK